MKTLLIILCILLFPCVVAAVTVNSTTGTWTHGNSATISGANFGTKSPAAPLWWDNGEGATVDTDNLMESGELTWVISGSLSGSNKHYISAWPSLVPSPYDTTYNMQYRNSGYRSMGTPHTRSSKFMAGGHWEDGVCGGNTVGRDVNLTVTDGNTSDIWYVSYYLRLDDTWPAIAAHNNYKYFNWETAPPYDMYSLDKYDATNACSGGHDDLRRSAICNDTYATAGKPEIMSATCGDTDWYPSITVDTNASNERRQWVKDEYMLKASTDYYKNLHNNVAMVDTTLYPACELTVSSGSVGGVTLGGYYRYQYCAGTTAEQHNDAWRYFDDVYIDKTFSRVMLCSSPTYPTANTAVCEPQIPSAWAADEISVTVNLGALTGTTGYLYVFDSTNTCNSTGYTVTLDQEGEECTGDGDCDDSNVCTTDTCVNLSCVNANNSADCPDDEYYCNGTETCGSGSCSVHSGDPCSGATPICNETTDQCDACDEAADCEDYNDCTTNTCSEGACSYPAVANGTACNDGDWCTVTDTCTDGVCGGTGSPCAEGYYCNDMEQTCDLISVGHKIIFIQGN